MDHSDYIKNLEGLDSNFAEISSNEVCQEDRNQELLMDYTSEYTTSDIYTTADDAIAWARGVGKRNGHVIIVKTSDVNDIHRRPRVLLACERQGSYKPSVTNETGDVKKRRKTGTKRCGCPFTLKCGLAENGEGWVIEVLNGMHNHSEAENFEGHSFAGRLTQEETDVLVDMLKNLVRPKEILKTLKSRDPFNATIIKTIYNGRSKYNVLQRTGRSELQHLLGDLYKHKYFEYHRTSIDAANIGANIVSDLIYAHPMSMDLLRD